MKTCRLLAALTGVGLCLLTTMMVYAEEEGAEFNMNSGMGCDDYFPKYDRLVHHGVTEATVESFEGEMSPLEMAEFYLPMVLEVCSKHRGLNALLVETRVALGKNREALAAIGHVLEWAPNDVDMLRLGAQLQGIAGNFTASLEMLGRAQAAAPGDASLLSDQCALLNVGKRYQEAVTYCSKLIEAKPVDLATLLFIRGKSYEGLGQLDKAKIDLDQARKLGFNVK